jgi:hypothetical protein
VQPPNIYIYIREGATTLFYKEENLAFSEWTDVQLPTSLFNHTNDWGFRGLTTYPKKIVKKRQSLLNYDKEPSKPTLQRNNHLGRTSKSKNHPLLRLVSHWKYWEDFSRDQTLKQNQ